jgi:hypothetical protein
MSVIDPPVAPPAPPVPSYGWPTWLRRTIIGVLLVICVGLMAWAGHRSSAGKPVKDKDPVIVLQSPAPGATDIRQVSIGANLRFGYDGRLTINGIAIPESQMDGARDPATLDARDLKENGLRPNNRNSVYFTPGPGKIIDKIPSGTVYVSLRYFPERRPNAGGRTITWTFTAV